MCERERERERETNCLYLYLLSRSHQPNGVQYDFRSDFGAGAGGGFDSEASRRKFEKFKNSIKRNPVPEEARRWMRQAKADLKSAYNDFGAEEPAFEWVLLKVHQVSQCCSLGYVVGSKCPVEVDAVVEN